VDSRNPALGEGEDVERITRTSKQISCVCDCFLSHSHSISIA